MIRSDYNPLAAPRPQEIEEEPYFNPLYQPSLRTVFKRAWFYSVTTIFVFMTSLAVFPGVLIVPRLDCVQDFSWQVFIYISLFNLSDTIGRYIATKLTDSVAENKPLKTILLAFCYIR